MHHKIRTRSDIVRELASIAIAARKSGDKTIWNKACKEWQCRASVAEKRRVPKAISTPWMEG